MFSHIRSHFSPEDSTSLDPNKNLRNLAIFVTMMIMPHIIMP